MSQLTLGHDQRNEPTHLVRDMIWSHISDWIRASGTLISRGRDHMAVCRDTPKRERGVAVTSTVAKYGDSPVVTDGNTCEY